MVSDKRIDIWLSQFFHTFDYREMEHRQTKNATWTIQSEFELTSMRNLCYRKSALCNHKMASSWAYYDIEILPRLIKISFLKWLCSSPSPFTGPNRIGSVGRHCSRCSRGWKLFVRANIQTMFVCCCPHDANNARIGISDSPSFYSFYSLCLWLCGCVCARFPNSNI